MSRITVSKIVYETTEFAFAQDGQSKSLGNMVDAMVVEALNRGEQLQGFEFMIEPAEWAELEADYHRGVPPVRAPKGKAEPKS